MVLLCWLPLAAIPHQQITCYRKHGGVAAPAASGGDFSQQNGRKHLVGEWVDGIKQGPFIRMYGNGCYCSILSIILMLY